MYRILGFALPWVVLLAWAITPSGRACAAVAIIANRTQTAIQFTATARPEGAVDLPFSDARKRRSSKLSPQLALPLDPDVLDSKAARHVVAAGDCVALACSASERLWIQSASFRPYELRPYRAYYFGAEDGGKIELREIGLAAVRQQPPLGDGLTGAAGDLDSTLSPQEQRQRAARRTIHVAVFADDDEPAVDRFWQKRLQDRVAEASKILARSCGMKLAVKSFGRWDSDDAVNDFEMSLREFERAVSPGDSQLAIGFTSQYQITRGRTHLGGTHGPLHTHILLREWSQHVSESERLELLVHELGHYLGAVHSPERNSVMRPLLGDRQARARVFRIAFDPVNALAMSVVGEEIRDRGISSFSELSPASRARLEEIYVTLAQSLPDDSAAASYLQYIRRSTRRP